MSRPLQLRLLALPLLALALVLGSAATASATAARHHARVARHAQVMRAQDIELAQIGKPYVWGAVGPRSFDCSGLVWYATHHAGMVHVPRTAAQQARFMQPQRKVHMHRGDYMFFYNRYGHVFHVAVFLRWIHGRAWMLHAPHTGSRVHRAYSWTPRWFGRTLRLPHLRHQAAPHPHGHHHAGHHGHHHKHGHGHKHGHHHAGHHHKHRGHHHKHGHQHQHRHGHHHKHGHHQHRHGHRHHQGGHRH